MYIDNIRASSLGSYKDCEFRYFLNFVCGIESVAGSKALFGTIIHAVMEILAKVKKTGHYKLKDKYCSEKYILDIVWKRYKKEYSEEHDFSQENYNFCAKQIANVLETRYNPFNLNVIATELQFALDIKIPGFEYEFGNKKGICQLRGTMDLITSPDKNTIELVDYKSGKRTDWITGEELTLEMLQNNLQLRVYSLALKVIYPDIQHFIFTLFYTQNGGPFSVTFDYEDKKKTIDEIRKLYNKIKACTMPTRIKDDPARKSEFFKCSYVCQFGKLSTEYKSDSGRIHNEICSIKEWKSLPAEMEIDGELYYKARSGTQFCDKYYNILKKEGIDKAKETITKLTIDGKPQEISRRNDYSRAKIFKGTLI